MIKKFENYSQEDYSKEDYEDAAESFILDMEAHIGVRIYDYEVGHYGDSEEVKFFIDIKDYRCDELVDLIAKLKEYMLRKDLEYEYDTIFIEGWDSGPRLEGHIEVNKII